MTVHLDIRNESSQKHLYRRKNLEHITVQACRAEEIDSDVELSVLFCNDSRVAELNQTYRKKNEPTDVLSFEQTGPGAGTTKVLGDIVISLETVAFRCKGDRNAMRQEVRLLFCHGLLHLLGYDHSTARERDLMLAWQSCLLHMPLGKSMDPCVKDALSCHELRNI